MMELVLPPAGLAEDLIEPVAPAPRVARIETWVTFVLARESYALPVSHVLEILRVAGITRVPHAPHVIRGVTNMRGKVLPVVDLRGRLGIEPAEVTAQSRILVVSSRGRLLGLLVDAVQQVERLDLQTVQPPPPDVMTAQSDYLIGVCPTGPRLVVLLDVARVLVLHSASERE